MNTNEYFVPICGTVNNPEISWNVQMATPTLKQEIPCIDASSSNSSVSVYTPEHLQSPEYVNYYDSKIDIVHLMKKEFPEDNEQLELTKKEIKLENTNENISLDTKEKDHKLEFEINIKKERQQQEEVSVNDGDVSDYSDALANLRKIEYKFVKKNIDNSTNNHNNEELDNDGTHDLHKCQYCDKHFDNYNIMLVHIATDHKNEKYKCEICVKDFKRIWDLRRHLQLVHGDQIEVIVDGVKSKPYSTDIEKQYRLTRRRNLRNNVKNRGEEEKGRCICDSCGSNFKSKQNLTIHIQRQHYDYGKTFDCWCGKQFRSPIHLREHERRCHRKNTKTVNKEFHCDSCQKVSRFKSNLIAHIS